MRLPGARQSTPGGLGRTRVAGAGSHRLPHRVRGGCHVLLQGLCPLLLCAPRHDRGAREARVFRARFGIARGARVAPLGPGAESRNPDRVSRLRVLHMVSGLAYGGLECLVAAMVRLSDHDRFETHVLTLGEFGAFAEGLEAFAQLHRFRTVPGLSMVWPGGLIRKIRAIAPDVVHTHSGVWYKASLAARHAGVRRLVHTDWGRLYPDAWTTRFLDGLAARRTDVVVAVSDALRRQLAETVVPDPSRIRVVVNGVDTHRFRPRAVNGSLRATLGLPAGAPVIGRIGRLD